MRVLPPQPEERVRAILELGHVERRLAEHRPTTISHTVAPRRAAVAVLLRLDSAPSVLLMKRATREDDRWSGHISFPGGRAEPHDRDLLATAVRETREEVAVDLERSARLLGQLDDVMAVAKGRVIPMAITPFVFLETSPVEERPSDEAEATLWLPLTDVLSGALTATFEYRLGPVPLDLPCWRHGAHVVWGLTHRMLSRLLELLSAA